MKITMNPPNSALVRPRTVLPDTNRKAKTRTTTSFVILALCGASMFLFIVSVCLITVLVLVGKSLSNQAANNFTSLANDSLLSLLKANRIAETGLLPGADYKFNNRITSTKHTISGSGSVNNEKTTVEMMPNLVSKVLDQLHFRLPREIRPSLYELYLYPDLNANTFSGNVSIHLKVDKPSSFIAVHSNKLSITSTLLEQLHEGEVRNISIANAFAFPKYEYWVTEVEQPLPIGLYVLRLAFNGSLTDRIVGFYGSSYYDPIKNVTR